MAQLVEEINSDTLTWTWKIGTTYSSKSVPIKMAQLKTLSDFIDRYLQHEKVSYKAKDVVIEKTIYGACITIGYSTQHYVFYDLFTGMFHKSDNFFLTHVKLTSEFVETMEKKI